MAKPGRSGLSRILYASRYSWLGIRAAFRHEAAFRQELLLLFMALPASLWLTPDIVERALLIGVVVLVLVVELLNSALEAVVDRISDEHHPLSGRAKDMGSAAVLFALLLALLVWGAVGWKHLAGQIAGL